MSYYIGSVKYEGRTYSVGKPVELDGNTWHLLVDIPADSTPFMATPVWLKEQGMDI